MFLLRRNLPLAWAGWYDSFDTYGVGPLQRPWVHLGDNTPADFTAEGWLHIPSGYFTNNGGGESYEFQPFTQNWGLEFEVWFPVEGLAAQSFTCFFTDSWARVGARFLNLVGVQLRHTLGGDTIGINQYATIIGFNDHEGQFAASPGYYGRWATVRIWVENDEWVRVWLDGEYQGSFNTHPTYKLGPDRRCVRFLNAALCDAWLAWIHHYDRPASIPPKTVWQQDFYDDFNGRSGNQNGVNGWVQFGADAAVVADSWSTTAAVDSSQGLLRDTGNASGRMRVEATVGGNFGPSSSADSSLILCSNADGTQALAANVYNGGLYISNLSGSLTSPTMADQQALPSGVTVSAGDKVAFTVYNNIGWIEVNGVPKLYAGSIHDVVPASNTYAGLRVERQSGNSNSWNDVRIYSGLG